MGNWSRLQGETLTNGYPLSREGRGKKGRNRSRTKRSVSWKAIQQLKTNGPRRRASLWWRGKERGNRGGGISPRGGEATQNCGKEILGMVALKG